MRNNRNNLSIIKEDNSKCILENETDDSKSNKSNLSIFKSTKYEHDKENPFKNNHLHNKNKENKEKQEFDMNNLAYESLPKLNKEENSENHSNSLINTATLKVNRSPNKKLSIIKTTNLENNKKEHLRLSPVKHSSLKMTKNQEELFERLYNNNDKKEGSQIKKERILVGRENILDVSIIPDYILNEHIKYNGKIDKVRLFQHFREYWKATPIINKDYKYCELNKRSTTRIYDEEEEIPKEKKVFLRKMKNIRKPISYYKKF